MSGAKHWWHPSLGFVPVCGNRKKCTIARSLRAVSCGNCRRIIHRARKLWRDLVEMIWRSKGWLPPTVGEKMVVSMPSGRYEVRKIEDR